MIGVLLCACGLAGMTAGSAFGRLELVPRPAWEPNGSVLAVARAGDKVFLGGAFTYVGPHTGSGAALNKSSGRPNFLFPRVEGGFVSAVEPDGAGGVYLGGSFKSVGGLPRYGLVHVLGDGRVDSAFAPFVSTDPDPVGSPDSWAVSALELDGARLYVGGAFRWIGGTERTGLAAVATGSGAVLPWNPNHTGSVSDIEVSDSAVYVTTNGGFVVNGTFVPGTGVAELDPVSALPTAWAPPLWGAEALALAGSTLYVGGSLVGPQPTTQPYSLAAFDVVTHEPLAWSPPVFPGSIRQLLVSGSTLYVRGDFTSPRYSLAAVNRTTGALLPFDSGPNRGTTALALDGSALVAGRHFADPTGVGSYEIELLDASTGASSGLVATTENRVYAVAPVGTQIVAGGEFRSVAGVRRRNLAALDVNTGEATSLDAPVTGVIVAQVRALTVIGSTVYLGGAFDSVGGVGRTDLAAIDSASGAVLPWAPALACQSGPCDTYIQRLATDGTSIFMVGNFDTLAGAPRPAIGAVTTTGTPTGFAPALSASPLPPFGRVSTIVPADGRVYVGGDFQSINAVNQPYLAALDPATGARLSWDPAVNGMVTGIASAGDRVFLTGAFSHVGGQFQPTLASVNTLTGGLDFSFRPEASTVIDAITVVGPQVVIAAAGGHLNGRLVQGIVGLDRASGDLSIPAGADALAATALVTASDGWLGVGATTTHQLSGYLSFTTNATPGGDSSPPPAPPPPSGGGGGGGGGVGPDVELLLAASDLSPLAGATVEVRVAVRNTSTSLAARGLHVAITLPGDATLLGLPSYETGSGCTGASALSCNLEYLSPNATSTLRFSINVGAAGVKQMTASTTMSSADPNLANNSGGLTLTVRPPASLRPPTARPAAPAVNDVAGTGRADVLRGTSGRDVLRGLGGGDKLFGRGGDDTLLGGPGKDRLVGGPGRDKHDGGSGDDIIEARDGRRDSIVCGAGRDTVYADRGDIVGRSCERVRRR